MKKILVATAIGLLLATALAGTAEAKCGTGCLSKKVKKLSKGLSKAQKSIASLSQTVSQQEQTLASQAQTIAAQGKALTTQEEEVKLVFGCLYEYPLTEYGEEEGSEGYEYDTGTETINTTALDVPGPGELVEAWPIYDACNTAESYSAHTAGSSPFSTGNGVFPARPGLR